LGSRVGRAYIIESGLEEGELVVTNGAFKIDSALQLQARPSRSQPRDANADTSEEPQVVERIEASTEFLAALSPVYRAALDTQEALAADDVATARIGLGALKEAIAGVDMGLARSPAHMAWGRLAARLSGAVGDLAETPTIEDARAVFGQVSPLMLELEQRLGHSEGELYEVFCPMALEGKGAAWLQADDTVNNPFFGASMLRCGDVLATFPPAITEPPAEPSSQPTSRPAEDEQDSEQGNAGARLRQQLDALVSAYFATHLALGSDRAASPDQVAALQQAARALDPSQLDSAAKNAWSTVEPGLTASVNAFVGAPGIEAQRTAFSPLSNALVAVLARFGHGGERSVRRFHCPMALGGRGADWLQEDERTLNPYYGSRMLRCGSEQDVLPAEGRGDQ
ncbi:DUF3347 domain-containing protein, partial [Planctomycetota bacterium]|nr:DUF3347 domain-containing protein [Planctomycetota bacterium]